MPTPNINSSHKTDDLRSHPVAPSSAEKGRVTEKSSETIFFKLWKLAFLEKSEMKNEPHALPIDIMFDYPISGRKKVCIGITLLIWGIIVMMILFWSYS